jgi:hypothetical protein
MMTVIQFPQHPPPERNPDHSCVCRSVPIRGTFRAPGGLDGTMTGSLRLRQVRMSVDPPRVDAVFTGELFDGQGERIGTCSRRQSAPALLGDTDDAPLIIGPVRVDLMGLAVKVPEIRIPRTCDAHGCQHRIRRQQPADRTLSSPTSRFARNGQHDGPARELSTPSSELSEETS